MAHKRFRKPIRPKVWRLPPPKVPKWLLLEPQRLGALAGMSAGLLCLIVSLVRQQLGVSLSPGNVIFGVFLSFVVGYATVGLFVLFILYVTEKEIPDDEEYVHISSLMGGRPAQTAPSEDENENHAAAEEAPAPSAEELIAASEETRE